MFVPVVVLSLVVLATLFMIYRKQYFNNYEKVNAYTFVKERPRKFKNFFSSLRIELLDENPFDLWYTAMSREHSFFSIYWSPNDWYEYDEEGSKLRAIYDTRVFSVCVLTGKFISYLLVASLIARFLFYDDNYCESIDDYDACLNTYSSAPFLKIKP